ncbi:MAG: YdcH family protein [Gammaproteobacteria bacterium]
MFENDHSAVETLLETDGAFRRLYDKHAHLNARVDEVTAGDAPMEETDLEALKKEKLHLADCMQDMIRDFNAHH